MKNFVNYYMILNVPAAAGDREIKKAFLKLAQKYHPDKNHGNKLAERKFKQVNLAYQTLQDPDKRKAFDEILKKNKREKALKPSAPRYAAPARREEKALDLEVPLEVSLESLRQSETHEIIYMKPENGGKLKSRLEVPVPLGVKPGTKLRFKKLGGANGTKLFGDLYIKITLKSHKIFQARENDILLSMPIRFVDAIKGKKIKVPSLYGFVALTLPPHIKDRHALRLKNMGLPRNSSGERGDMFVTIFMDFPRGDRAKIQSKMKKNMPLEKKRFYIRKYDSENCLYSKVLDFQKKVREIQKAGQK